MATHSGPVGVTLVGTAISRMKAAAMPTSPEQNTVTSTGSARSERVSRLKIASDDALTRGASMAEEVAALTARLQAYYGTRKITSKDEADKCENGRQALAGAARALDTQRKAENKPHDDAIAATNAAYFPAIRGAGPVLAIMERKINEWGEGEAKRLTEQAAAAERAAAEKLGRATDEAPPAPVVPPKVMVGTIGNRRSAAPKAPPATATITNWPQATLYYGDHPRLRALVQELANYDARAKKPVPGATMSWETSEKQEAANA